MEMKAFLEGLGGQVVLVDFHAGWCRPCRAMEPVIEKLKHQYCSRVKIIRVDIDDQKHLALQLMVQSLPTFILFQGGVEVKRLVGVQPESCLQAHLEAVIKSIA